mgnify:CR=1 FL=1
MKSLKGPKYAAWDKDAPHPTDDWDKLKKKLKSTDKDIDEAEYNGKDVELNKQKRGGSKKYNVYVKNPKQEREKKITSGKYTVPKRKAKQKNKTTAHTANNNREKNKKKIENL